MAAIQIKYCDIPIYLRAGDFCRNLDSDDPEGIIEVPADCFHPDGKTAADVEEFRQLLRVMVFWMLDDIPLGVLKYCSAHEVNVWEKGLADLTAAVDVEIQPLLTTAYSNPRAIPLNDIIKTGRWDLIMHAVGRIAKSSNATARAAFHGSVRLLKYLHEQGFTWHEDTCAVASELGYRECLQYAHENGCPWDVQVYLVAASSGHLSCMQYAYEQALEWHLEVCKYAAGNGHLECLRYARENGCPWDAQVYTHAASYGHLSCMQYAFEQGLEWHVGVCKYAALKGRFDCLQFAHENGCPWDNKTTECAAQGGHTHCLLYALEHGCPVNQDACNWACKDDHLECLQLLDQFGAPWCEYAPFHAAMSPNVACLQYLHENGCPWDEDTTNTAATEGRIGPLRYALQHDCPYYDHVVECTARSSNIECMQYVLEEQSLRMDEDVFLTALLRGDLTCLQYLIDQGCPYLDAEYDDDVEEWILMDDLFRKDNLEFIPCVEYAVERGWTPDQNFMNYIVTRDESCRDWLIKEGYYVEEMDVGGTDTVVATAKRKYEELL